MKRIICIASICLLVLTSCAEKVLISTERLQDKIKGGWAGQTFGCAYGGPTEFRYNGVTIPEDYVAPWDDSNHVKWYFDYAPGLYDDVYMDLSFLKVMDLYGLEAPADSFAITFAKAGYPLWHANQAARYNILSGIQAPMSGHWKNNPHADDIDFQIEADFAGLISPAMPRAAAAVCDKVGHIMNYGDGYYGGLYVATMYSLAFVEDDIDDIVEDALKVIPRKSDFYKCISDVIRWCDKYDDWRVTWQKIEDKWSREIGCPDGVDSPFDIDAKINSAYVVLGLLYGDEDIARTMDISMRCGQDSDCNPATCAGILGTMLGYSNIPPRFRNPIEEVLDRDFAHTDVSLRDACRITMDLATYNVEKNGGKVGKGCFRIPMRRIRTAAYEKSFDIFRTAVQDYEGCGNFSDVLSCSFEGRGVVLTGWVDCVPGPVDPSYVARISVSIDGCQAEEFDMPVDFITRKYDIYWNYNLADGSHTAELKWLNPIPEASIKLRSKVVYN